ncbi:TetR/AcrR family transcriptional regulator [Pelagibaculum spongiae]|uniref:HTH tetR-type domain-containing protein n=1 Tax=Pelagibaculum spongiae TaxID=2080658 RepID=A0A2V1GY89_9GAMM|nr:TetR/AcrR family transcriptional regulator [Pelagibaculum spongiae]PVZ69605.1 hypothetical protein DC094_09870 [Pelagibaculum spongiae]
MNEDKADTRQKLLLAALNLFAEQGIDGVSMRTINSMAGAKNASAVHYHFGSRVGILEAILQYFLERLRPLKDDALQWYLSQPEPQLRDLLRTTLSPLLTIYYQDPQGKDLIRLLARIHLDGQPEARRLVNQYMGEMLQQLDAMLTDLLPDIPKDVLRRRILVSLLTVIHCLSEMEWLSETPLGDLQNVSPVGMFSGFLDFLAGGITAPVSRTEDDFKCTL